MQVRPHLFRPQHGTSLGLIGIFALLCAGCTSAPVRNDVELAADTPTVWLEDTLPVLAGTGADLSGWWQHFSDPLLNNLVDSGLDASTEVQKARAALLQATALRDVASAALSPTLGFSASAQHNLNGDGKATDNLQAGVNAGWNPDLSGVRARALDASTANLQAIRAQLGGVQGGVASSIALNYIVLRNSQARLAIARQNLVSQHDTLQIVQWRNQAGLIGSIEVEQALVAAQQTGAQLSPLEQSIARTVHALSVQVGRPPGALAPALSTPSAVPVAPAGLQLMAPADMLRARPDVQAAQFQFTRAMAEVDQARAQKYPALNLGANLGVGAASAAALSSSGAALAGVIVSLAGPLFDGGATQAQVRAAQAAAEQAGAAYRAAQLTALREVEDALVALRTDSARAEQLAQVALAANRAATMARQRFASGLVDFQIVLETQRSQLAAQDTKAQADATVSSDQVVLYNVLGGGWKPDSSNLITALPPTP